MQFNEYDKEREQIILHHFIYRGLKDGGGGGEGGLKIVHTSGKILAMPLSCFFRTTQDLQNNFTTCS